VRVTAESGYTACPWPRQAHHSTRRRTTTATTKEVTVSEIYSPPRVTQLLREMRARRTKQVRHIMPGFAFDLTTNDPDDGMPWDFGIESKRDKARALLREQKPYLLIGSPMCTAFSQWQRLNAAKTTDKAAMERARAHAVAHVKFVVSLYEEQVDGGRYFLHEHPLYADSWELKCAQRLSATPEVQRVYGNQCQFGA